MGVYLLQGLALLVVFGALARWAFRDWKGQKARRKPIAACLFAAAALFGLGRVLFALAALAGLVNGPSSILVEKLLADPETRQASFDALVARGGEAAPALVEALGSGTLPDLEALLVDALVRIGEPAVEPLLAASRGSGPGARGAVRVLARIRDASGDPALAARIREGMRPSFPMDVRVERSESDYERQMKGVSPGGVFQYRAGVVHAMGTLEARPDGPAELVALLSEENHAARETLAGIVADAGLRAPGEILPELEKAIREADEWRFRGSVAAMKTIDPSCAALAPILADLVAADAAWNSVYARDALREMGPAARAAVPSLAAKLERLEGQALLNALDLLGKLGPLAAEAAGPVERLLARERAKGGGEDDVNVLATVCDQTLRSIREGRPWE